MKKSLVLFIHGIGGSSTGTWGTFPDLIRADRLLAAKFDVACDNYPSRKTGRLFERVGGLDIAAEGLKSRIGIYYDAYEEIAIIAHSQGGLIALRYILDRLLATEPLPVTRLITFATPYHGAMASGVGSFLGGASEQAEDFAPESPFLFRLSRDWALFRGQHSVLMKAVAAGCDGVVGPASAAGLGIPYEVASAGNHETIVKPNSVRDEGFVIAKRFLLGPLVAARARHRSVRSLKLPENARAALRESWQRLEASRLDDSNTWREEWNGSREHFERTFAAAAEAGLAETWQAVSDAGLELRETMRASAEDPYYLPRYYLTLVEYTDAVVKALKAAGGTPGNLLPPEQDELVARIEKLEAQVEEERVVFEAGNRFPDLSQATRQQIAQLTQRLQEIEGHLASSKGKATQVEQMNITTVDPASIKKFIREALETLKRGIDLLDDKRFSETLRRAAEATRLTGQRYARAIRRRFETLKLPWRQDKVFEDFERLEPNFDLLSNKKPLSQKDSVMAEAPILRPLFDGGSPSLETSDPVGGDLSDYRDKTILLVDNDHGFLSTFSQWLRGVGIINVYTASTGELALKLCNNNDIDLVLLDFDIPALGGLEVLERLRQQDMKPSGTRTKVIMYTDRNDASSGVKAARAGATDYLLRRDVLTQGAIRIRRAFEHRDYVEHAGEHQLITPLSENAIEELNKNNEEEAIRVLLVEDNPAVASVFKSIIRSGGHGVNWASSEGEAISYLRARSYHAVFVDLQLAGDDIGYKVVLDIISYIDHLAEGTKIFVVSGASDARDIVESFYASRVDFIMKSEITSASNLLDYLTKALGQKLNLLGKFDQLTSFLAAPQYTLIWESELIGVLGEDFKACSAALDLAYLSLLPILRKRDRNTVINFDHTKKSLESFFWSKGLGCAMWVSLAGRNGQLIAPPPEFKGELKDSSTTMDGITFTRWRIPEIERDLFIESV